MIVAFCVSDKINNLDLGLVFWQLDKRQMEINLNGLSDANL